MYTDPINRESNIKHYQRLICLPEHQVKNLEKLYALIFSSFSTILYMYVRAWRYDGEGDTTNFSFRDFYLFYLMLLFIYY